MIGSRLGIYSSQGETFDGLLDLYPTAAAGYSLRQLRNGYSGSCIKVRRSSDNAEQDIGFLINVLDTASMLSFVGANDGFITKLYDQSGNNSDFIQTNASSQPQIVSSGSVLLENLLSTIVLDGVNDSLGNTSLSLSNTTTYFNVYTALADVVEVPFDGDSASERQLPMFVAANKFNINGGTTRIEGQASDLNQNLHTTSFDTLDNAYTNGVQQITNVSSGTDVVNGAVIGNVFNGTSAANINLQELIIYDSNRLSDRVGIEANINAYYGIY